MLRRKGNTASLRAAASSQPSLPSGRSSAPRSRVYEKGMEDPEKADPPSEDVVVEENHGATTTVPLVDPPSSNGGGSAGAASGDGASFLAKVKYYCWDDDEDDEDDGKDDDDDERKKKKMVTPWRRRRNTALNALTIVLVTLTVALTARGYHRRHHARVETRQRKAWDGFKSANGLPAGKESSYENMESYLQGHREVAEKWGKHLAENKEVATLFSERPHAHGEWKPDSYFDSKSDELGEGIEYVGHGLNAVVDAMKEAVDDVGGGMHTVLDGLGDVADGVGEFESFTAMFDALASSAGATADSVSQWMEGDNNVTDVVADGSGWTDLMQSFLNAPAALWNYTATDMDNAEKAEADSDGGSKAEAGDENLAGDKPVADGNAGGVAQGGGGDGGGAAEEKAVKALPDFMANPEKKRFAFVMTGFPTKPENLWRFETYVLNALKGHLKDTVLFYIVRQAARKMVVERICALPENEEACSRLMPVYVVCPPEDYGIATCCTLDKGMRQVATQYPDFDYYVYQDDDIYFRTDYLHEFVSGIPDPRTQALLLSSSPMVAQGSLRPPRRQRKEGDEPPTKEEVGAGCSTKPNHLYPLGAPAVIYSNAALKTVLPGYQQMATTKECTAFEVSAVSGSAIVHWMYQLPVIRLPNVVGHHNAATKLAPGDEPNAKRLQNLMGYRVDGMSRGGANFTDVHAVLQNAKTQAAGADLYPKSPFNFNFHSPKGYAETKLYEKFGLPQNWTTGWNVFKPDDCIRDEA